MNAYSSMSTMIVKIMMIMTIIAMILSTCGTGTDAQRVSQQTPASIQALLDTQNHWRSTITPAPATPMPALQWSSTLAQVAETYALKCNYAHNSNRAAEAQALDSTFGQVGENIAAGTSSTYKFTSPASFPTTEKVGRDAVGGWADSEYPDWTYAPIGQGDCATGAQCGHLTQIIWAKTTHVGCAVVQCGVNSPFSSASFSNWVFTVCNYSPAGNYGGQYPYVKATTTTTPTPTTTPPTPVTSGSGSGSGQWVNIVSVTTLPILASHFRQGYTSRWIPDTIQSCTQWDAIPFDQLRLRVTLGDYVDYFKPITTLCQTLESVGSWYYHSYDGVNGPWQAVNGNHSALLGGFFPYRATDKRVWGPFWGAPDGPLGYHAEGGGCCHASSLQPQRLQFWNKLTIDVMDMSGGSSFGLRTSTTTSGGSRNSEGSSNGVEKQHMVL